MRIPLTRPGVTLLGLAVMACSCRSTSPQEDHEAVERPGSPEQIHGGASDSAAEETSSMDRIERLLGQVAQMELPLGLETEAHGTVAEPPDPLAGDWRRALQLFGKKQYKACSEAGMPVLRAGFVPRTRLDLLAAAIAYMYAEEHRASLVCLTKAAIDGAPLKVTVFE